MERVHDGQPRAAQHAERRQVRSAVSIALVRTAGRATIEVCAEGLGRGSQRTATRAPRLLAVELPVPASVHELAIGSSAEVGRHRIHPEEVVGHMPARLGIGRRQSAERVRLVRVPSGANVVDDEHIVGSQPQLLFEQRKRPLVKRLAPVASHVSSGRGDG